MEHFLNVAKNPGLPIKERLCAFLSWMTTHYTSENRGVDDIKETCTYTAGCAIGIHIENFEIKRVLNELGSWRRFRNILKNNDDVSIELDGEMVPISLDSVPEWMIEIDMETDGAEEYVLEYAQRLHDAPRFWNENGLTESGVSYLNLIYRVVGLGELTKTPNLKPEMA